MKYLDEYRDEQIGQSLVKEIARRTTRPWVLMEVCGGQTHTLMRYGIDDLMPAGVELVHGPGCPVCVTSLETMDRAIQIALHPGTILVSYGDMLRVPGSGMDLLRAKARGADVRIVYSPLEALKIARANAERQVVFFGIGFETTAPANAMAVWQAKQEGLRNFSMLASHVLVPPALRLLLGSSGNRVQGLIAPGHVCAVTGFREYEALSSEFRIPIVVGGFEPVDLLEAIAMLIAQLEEGRVQAENQYCRSVSYRGNERAQRIVEEVFEVSDQKWRGIGEIPRSGLRLREEFAGYDAGRIFQLESTVAAESPECISALILQGLKKPVDCPVFATRCAPENPLGAPMVSAEGACAAYYQYRRHERAGQVAQGANS